MQLKPRWILAALAVLCLPVAALAQTPATISGTVTREDGSPLPGATIAIPTLGVGATTRPDGRYSLVFPQRAEGQTVTLSVRAIGYKPQTRDVTVSGDQSLDFSLAPNPLQLGELVVTGAGTETEVEKLGNVRNNVDSSLIARSNETNLVTALAAKAPNVEVISTSGDPGASTSIRIRGANTLGGTGDPLFVVDGLPIDNSTTPTSQFDGTGFAGQQGTAAPNRAIDIDPNDIESVEILKGAAAGSIYGARAGQGVILITTKRGRPGATQYSLRSTIGVSDVHRFPALQRRYGLGDEDSTGVPTADPCVPSTDPALVDCFATSDSWGPLLGAGTPTYDHAQEAFTSGWNSDNNLTISGGNDRTQFFVSAGYSYDRGFYVGPNNHFQRVSVRVNGSQQVSNNLKVGANVAYANTAGSFVQKGSNFSGITLDAWRTAPEFNNQPYLDPISGLQRSYRFPNPSPVSFDSTRGYDNPFFTANAPLSTAYADRVFGNLSFDWTPARWLKFNYTLGVDYSGDDRLQGQPQTSSNTPSVLGQVVKVDLTNSQIDHNLTGTVNYKVNDGLAGTFTLGQNLNTRSIRQLGGVGNALLAPEPFTLTNTAGQLPPIDNETKLRIEGYFAQATLDLGQQLFLKGGVRYDGASSFGANTQYAWFPSASAAWQFTKATGEGSVLSYGKLRAAYGEVGTQPQPYLTGFTFLSGGLYQDGWGGTLTASQNGFGGLFSDTTKAGDLRPERTREFEAGVDLGLFKDIADLSFTWYRRTSKDVILTVPVPASTGFLNQAENAGSIRNSGTEWALNIRPITHKNFAWDLGFQVATNRNKVLNLGTADTSFFISYGGAGGFAIAEAQVGLPIGVFRDYDYIRCGRGLTIYDVASGGAVSVDGLCTAAQNQQQALFINDGNFMNANNDAGNTGPSAAPHSSAGYPLLDPASRVVGDPNPSWTGSIRSSVRIGRLSLSALVDIRHGGVVYNGTRGALNSLGTSKESGDLRYQTVTVGQNFLPGPVAGPGVGTPVLLDEGWFQNYYSTFTFLGVPFYEDASFTKLREVSVGYSLTGGFVSRSLGFSSVDLRLSGRNLFVWTNYTGVDPETNLAGAETGARNIDWFNSAQSRSFVFTVTLNR